MRNKLFVGYALLVMLALFNALYFAFGFAPVESKMGVVQKIFYFHVPSAISMFYAFGLCAVMSLLFLLVQRPREGGFLARPIGFIFKRRDKIDALARTGAEIGLVFALIVLITGPLWGRKAWGHYWEWDPQLTLVTILFMIYLAYLFLRSYAGESEQRKRIAAGLGVIGFLDVPLIHYAVKLWGGTHPNVMREGGGGMDPKMKTAFLVCLFTMWSVLGILIWIRYVAEAQRLKLVAAQRAVIELEMEQGVST